MIKGSYHLAEVKPTIDVLPNTAFDANDVLFDWFRFEIPRGSVNLKSIFATVAGTDATASNTFDIGLIFATSLNGAAPPSLGDPDSAPTVIKGAAVRNHLIGHAVLDASKVGNDDSEFVGYNVFAQSSIVGNQQQETCNVMEGDPSYAGATTGFQSIWVAGFAAGAFDFGTACLIDGAVTDLTTRTFDVSEDTDADDLFCIGDELLACAADGSSVQRIGTVTAVAADTVTTDGVGFDGALADDDEVCFRTPVVLKLGFEY